MNNEELKEPKSEIRSQKSAVNSTYRQRADRADGPLIDWLHVRMRNNNGKLQYAVGEQSVAGSIAIADDECSCKQRQSGRKPFAKVVAIACDRQQNESRQLRNVF